MERELAQAEGREYVDGAAQETLEEQLQALDSRADLTEEDREALRQTLLEGGHPLVYELTSEELARRGQDPVTLELVEKVQREEV